MEKQVLSLLGFIFFTVGLPTQSFATVERVAYICELESDFKNTKILNPGINQLPPNTSSKVANAVRSIEKLEHSPRSLFSYFGFEGKTSSTGQLACQNASALCRSRSSTQNDRETKHYKEVASLIMEKNFFGIEMSKKFEKFCEINIKDPNYCEGIKKYTSKDLCATAQTDRYQATQNIMDSCYVSDHSKRLVTGAKAKNCDTEAQTKNVFEIADMGTGIAPNTVDGPGSCGVSIGNHIVLSSRTKSNNDPSIELIIRNAKLQNPKESAYICTVSEDIGETRVVRHIKSDSFGKLKDATVCGTSKGDIDPADDYDDKKDDFEDKKFACLALNKGLCKKLPKLSVVTRYDSVEACSKALTNPNTLKNLSSALKKASSSPEVGSAIPFGAETASKMEKDRDHYVFNSFLRQYQYEEKKRETNYKLHISDPSNWVQAKLHKNKNARTSICNVLRASIKQCSQTAGLGKNQDSSVRSKKRNKQGVK